MTEESRVLRSAVRSLKTYVNDYVLMCKVLHAVWECSDFHGHSDPCDTRMDDREILESLYHSSLGAR